MLNSVSVSYVGDGISDSITIEYAPWQHGKIYEVQQPGWWG
ncbi:hypothetical protein ACVWXM_002561 [Bradyrhizobium sp. GM7.3]